MAGEAPFPVEPHASGARCACGWRLRSLACSRQDSALFKLLICLATDFRRWRWRRGKVVCL